MNEDQEIALFMATMATFGCVVLLCLCCMESRRGNNSHPTQPNRRFHELIQDIKPTINYKPPAPPPIPVVKFNSHNFKNVVECVVCLSNLVDGDKARVMPTCKHCFHVDCIDKWLKCNSICPVCRINVVGRLALNDGSIFQSLPSIGANSVMDMDSSAESETRDGQ
ncbi:hypothetical protein BRARA_E02690 [Brassica rapa]|uniref:RING-type domain-containing protein n=2 Tax=Brassica campestris TaxID=3711 RepID=A0A397ZFI2_BRACM|nr:putative RING-H2 finger protein ATL62 [Brassica rapa]RID63708.1 hypothetical protein BRARA_E02690 [Brassica rapa]